MPDYRIPASVLANAEKRLAVTLRTRHHLCSIDGCDQAATHWPFTSHPACETHRILPAPPVSDPARRLYALRDRAAAERALLAEEQLLTVRIRYRWHPEWAEQTRRRAA